MLILVLPVYNEEKNIEQLLADISAYAKHKSCDYRVCVVDDGSTDATVDVVHKFREELPVEIISNPKNMGPGAAFDNGFRHVLDFAGPDDIVITMEADNTSDLVILDEMLKKIALGTDLALASCYAKGGGIEGTTLYRAVLSKGANFLIYLVSGEKRLKTFSSFYRCYRAGVLRKAYHTYGNGFIEEKGFVCAVDIFIKLQNLGIRVEEVPMILRCDRREGKSKMKTLLTMAAYLRLFAREVIRASAGKRPKFNS